MIGSIEIDQDLTFQKRSWAVQRVSWMLMIVIAIAALLGFFGDGPLASAQAGDESSVTVSYDRFVRSAAPQKLTISVGRSAAPAGSIVQVWLDRTWLSKHDVRGIIPEPKEERLTPYAAIYQFSVDSTSSPIKIEFDLETRAMGVLKGKAGIVGGNTVQFNQFAYP